MTTRFFIFISIVFLAGCSSPKKLTVSQLASSKIGGLKFVNEFDIPNAVLFKGTVVGGLSGIDYDRERNLYYLICDDPSAQSPSRFYTARLAIGKKLDSVEFVDVTTILNKEGLPYPDIRKDRTHSADLEAMRYDPSRDELVRSTEGQRILGKDKTELQDPDIVIMDREGRYKDSFELPANMHMQAIEKGPRHNSVFEGVAYSPDYKSVYVSVEDAIYDDGDKAGTGDSTAWIRILKFDRTSRKQVAQFAYQVDAVPYPADPAGAFKINGVSDIMQAGDDRFIVIERAYSTGRIASDIRLYLANAAKATDVSGIGSLRAGEPFNALHKKLLINLEELGRHIDNIEGCTFGPILPNGNRSLVLVADDNFDKRQTTQFFLFEVLP
jgi:hypothetical protein